MYWSSYDNQHNQGFLRHYAILRAAHRHLSPLSSGRGQVCRKPLVLLLQTSQACSSQPEYWTGSLRCVPAPCWWPSLRLCSWQFGAGRVGQGSAECALYLVKQVLSCFWDCLPERNPEISSPSDQLLKTNTPHAEEAGASSFYFCTS